MCLQSNKNAQDVAQAIGRNTVLISDSVLSDDGFFYPVLLQGWLCKPKAVKSLCVFFVLFNYEPTAKVAADKKTYLC